MIILLLLLVFVPPVIGRCTLMCESKDDSFSQLCTHQLIHADITKDYDIELTSRSMDVLKRKRPDNAVPIILIVGDDQYGGLWRGAMAQCKRNENIIRMTAMMDTYNITGVSFSWSKGMFFAHDADLLILLFNDLRKNVGDRRQLYLGASVNIAATKVYEKMKVLRRTVDKVILHTHELHTFTPTSAALLTPLYPASGATNDNEKLLNVETIVSQWTKYGWDRRNLIIGLTAGINELQFSAISDHRPYQLAFRHILDVNPTSHILEFVKPITGQGICKLEHDVTSNMKFEEKSATHHLTNKRLFFSYETEPTMRMKASWSALNGGGVALFDLQSDTRRCNRDGWSEEFPLLRTISKAMLCDPICDNAIEPGKTEGEKKESPTNGRNGTAHSVSCSFRISQDGNLDPMPITSIPFDLCSRILLEEAYFNSTYVIDFPSAQALSTMRTLMSKFPSSSPGNKKYIISIRCSMPMFELDQMLSGGDINWRVMGINLLNFVEKYGLDGMEFLCDVDGLKRKKEYGLVLEFLLAKFKSSGRTLSLRIPIDTLNIDMRYNVSILNELESISIQPFTVPARKIRAHLSSPMLSARMVDDSVDRTVQFWIKCGLHPEKIVLNIASHGTLQDIIGDSANVQLGDFTSHNRIVNQSEMCIIKGLPTTELKMDYTRLGWYAISRDEHHRWLNGETIDTVHQKMAYVKQEGLGGINILSLNEDDWGDTCKSGKFPLLNAAHQHHVKKNFD